MKLGSRKCAPDDRLRDEAIQTLLVVVDCFASLAMTILNALTPPARFLH